MASTLNALILLIVGGLPNAAALNGACAITRADGVSCWASVPLSFGTALLGLPSFGWAIGPWLDQTTVIMMTVVLVILGVAYLVGILIQRQPDSTVNPAVVQAFNLRVRAWWLMFVILTAAFLLGETATVTLFFFVSFWALREFITLTPTRIGDHRTLFWIFFLFAPLQYILIAQGSDLYDVYSILIPVYVYLFIPARIAIAGDYKRFLERAAKIQAGILICVYALSYAPALLYLQYQTVTNDSWDGSRAGVLFYLILIVQIGDVSQYVLSRFWGRRIIAPAINESRTWEGFFWWRPNDHTDRRRVAWHDTVQCLARCFPVNGDRRHGIRWRHDHVSD